MNTNTILTELIGFVIIALCVALAVWLTARRRKKKALEEEKYRKELSESIQSYRKEVNRFDGEANG